MSTGTLTRLSSTDKSGPLRTDAVTCTFSDLPTVGERFNCVGPPLNDQSTGRIVSTSWVSEIKENDEVGITFTTETGSTYRLDIDPATQA